MPAGALKQQPGKCEADAGSLRHCYCALTERENSISVSGRDPRPVIVDRHSHEAFILHIDANKNAATGATVFYGVIDQVH